MIRFRGKDDLRMRAQSMPLIMPMPRSSYRVVDSNSPWVSVDPVFGKECLALYRSVRLTLLALIAFMTGPLRLRAETGHGDSVLQTRTGRLLKIQSPNSALDSQTAPDSQTRIARLGLRDPGGFRTRLISSARMNSERVVSAIAFALDAPKRGSPQLESRRTHAPPAASAPTGKTTVESDSFIRLLKSVPQHQTRFFPAYRQAFGQIDVKPFQVPPSTQTTTVGAAALALHTPKIQFPELEVIRAHAPPSDRLQIGFHSPGFDRSLTTDYSVHPAPNSILPLRSCASYPSRAAPATPAQITVISLNGEHSVQSLFRVKIQNNFRYHPRPMQSIDCNSRKSCQYKTAEKARLRQRCLPANIQSTSLKGDYLYVRC